MYDENKEKLMTLPCSYEELVKALRYCARFDHCTEQVSTKCPLSSKWTDGVDCMNALFCDAADEIEQLMAEVERLKGEAMETSRIIKELRDRHFAFDATGNHKTAQLFKEAADLIEELQDQPWVESVQVDKLNQRIDELENEKTNLEAEIINLEIALDKAHCELVRCKDCKWYKPSVILSPNRFCYRLTDNEGNQIGYNMAEDDYCSHAERGTDGKEEG